MLFVQFGSDGVQFPVGEVSAGLSQELMCVW